jgi:hypothetical protein
MAALKTLVADDPEDPDSDPDQRVFALLEACTKCYIIGFCGNMIAGSAIRNTRVSLIYSPSLLVPSPLRPFVPYFHFAPSPICPFAP